MGKLLGISYKTESRGEMHEVQSSIITIESGIENDYKGSKSKKRQITLLSKEDWESACKSLNLDLHWTVRRANLMIEGIDLKNSIQKQIKIGDRVLLEITSETKPCYRMDEQAKGLMDALLNDWKGGVCCSVIQGGDIKIGDFVTLID